MKLPKVSLVALIAGSLVTPNAGAGEWFRVLQTTSEAAAVAVSPSAPNVVYFVSTDAYSGQLTFYRSTDTGSTWHAGALLAGSMPPVTITGLAVDPSNPLVAYAATSSGAFKTTDGFDSWAAINVGLPPNPALSSIVLDPQAPSILYAATVQGVSRSNDGGATWFNASNGLVDSLGSLAFVLTIAVDPSHSSVLYAGSANAGVFKSASGGASWLPTGAIPGSPINSLAVDPNTTSVVYAGTGRNILARGSTGVGLFKSADGGVSWKALPAGSSPLVPAFNAIAIDPRVASTVWASNGSVIQTPDGGSTWRSANDGLTDFVEAVTVAGSPVSTVYLGTSGGLLLGQFAGDGTPLGGGDANHLWIQGRFRISVDWTTSGGGTELGTAVPVTSNTGAFWFFDPTNLELVVKVLDGRSINGKWWVFYGSLTNVQFTLTVTDTLTGAVRAYTNPQGKLASVADTSAF